MTDTDIEIVKFDYEHHEKLCAEIAQNKSFVGTMASIAAFVALEWARTDPAPKIVVGMVFGLLLAAAGLFLMVSLGKKYKLPATPQEWIDSRTQYAQKKLSLNELDDSDQAIKEMFYRRMLATTDINRRITKSRQRAVEWTGIFSVASVILVVSHSALRYVFS